MHFIFYNVENLFEFNPNSKPKDEAFGPTGKWKWNETRYKKKLDRIAEVVSAIGKNSPPAFLALCEVGNLQVVKALTNHLKLREYGYQIVHADSNDQRGIGVAFMYDPRVFKVEHTEWINIDDNDNKQLITRDILRVSGKVAGGQTMHIYVNHWPSRRLGPNMTESRRMSASSTLLESLEKQDLENDLAVLCGDFNDQPSDPSLVHLVETSKTPLINLAAPLEMAGLGTVNHSRKWLAFDQFIVNQNMLSAVKDAKMHVFDDDLVLYENHLGEKRPNRTYMGARYIGGYSDHLAISLELKF